MDKISIIIPVYNAEAYLARCIDSILAQTYKNFEVILVDDGSTDKSGNISDGYSSAHKNIKVVHQRNRGVSAARNKGIDMAEGEYISFVDADDAITPRYLEVLHDLLADDDNDIAVTDVLYVYDVNYEAGNGCDSNEVVSVVTGREAAKRMLYQKNINNGPFAKLISKKLFAAVRFDEKVTIGEDLDVNYKLFLKADKVAINSSKNYFYLQREGSAMQSSFSAKRLDCLVVLKRLLSEAEAQQSKIVASIKNRLFIEAVIVASEIQRKDGRYKNEFSECVAIVKSLRFDVFADPESRLRFKIYAGLSLISARLLIFVFTAKKLPKKLRIKRANNE